MNRKEVTLCFVDLEDVSDENGIYPDRIDMLDMSWTSPVFMTRCSIPIREFIKNQGCRGTVKFVAVWEDEE